MYTNLQRCSKRERNDEHMSLLNDSGQARRWAFSPGESIYGVLSLPNGARLHGTYEMAFVMDVRQDNLKDLTNAFFKKLTFYDGKRHTGQVVVS